MECTKSVIWLRQYCWRSIPQLLACFGTVHLLLLAVFCQVSLVCIWYFAVVSFSYVVILVSFVFVILPFCFCVSTFCWVDFYDSLIFVGLSHFRNLRCSLPVWTMPWLQANDTFSAGSQWVASIRRCSERPATTSSPSCRTPRSTLFILTGKTWLHHE